MKKKLLALALVFPLAILSTSCAKAPVVKVVTVSTIFTPGCDSVAAEDRLICEADGGGVMPFDSGITLAIYGEAEDLDEVKTSYVDTMAYYSAIFDRHHLYRARTSLDADFQDLYNLKKFNDSIAALDVSGENEKILTLPDLLYEGLKDAYDFTLNSGLKYNFAIGALSTLFDERITLAKSPEGLSKLPAKLKDQALTNLVMYGVDFDEEEYQRAKSATPDAEELEEIFSFQDDSKVKITRIKDNATDRHLSITLSGYAKGKAEEAFSALYPDLPILLNGGSSSIKTSNVKLSGNPWKIRITNPIYNEEMELMTALYDFPFVTTPLNDFEFYFQSEEDFNLSTSGYYNNYYYTYDAAGEFRLRHHIIDSSSGTSRTFFDSASVMIGDSGLGDLYSTALMNCDSVKEAESLRQRLDQIYGQQTWAFYTAHSKLEKSVKDKVTAYIPKSHKSMFKFISDLENERITEFEYF